MTDVMRMETNDGRPFYPQTHKQAVIGIDQIDNTSDINKPISNAVQEAIDGINNIIQPNIIDNNINIVDLQTDKALYSPSERVNFTCYTSGNFGKIDVVYWNGNNIIDSKSLTITHSGLVTWQWYLPPNDHKGYLAKIKYTNKLGSSSISEIAINVDTNWANCPLYGFLSWYPETMKITDMKKVINQLKRYHINGLQFYDWFDRHHIPLTTNEFGMSAQFWLGFAKQSISINTIKRYVDLCHSLNIKAMGYGLLYGAATNQEVDGLTHEMFLFDDASNTQVHCSANLMPWSKYNIYQMNPLNPSWNNYICNKMEEVYKYINFDGWHVDQLGNETNLYSSDGVSLDWGNYGDGFGALLNTAKTNRSDKLLVMNGVANYGQQKISDCDKTEFMYTENWSETISYNDMRQVIDYDHHLSGKQAVMAAYMNYDYAKSNPGQYFNTPGILLTDAVIFSCGGSHIELGEHMLCSEYFPNSSLNMSNELSNSIIKFYDFAVAYREFLRDMTYASTSYSSNTTELSSNFESNKLNIMQKENDQYYVINLINLIGENDTSWRDTNGDHPAPTSLTNIQLTINQSGKKVWYASPDNDEITPIVLNGNTQSSYDISIPYLKYWGIIVIEK